MLHHLYFSLAILVLLLVYVTNVTSTSNGVGVGVVSRITGRQRQRNATSKERERERVGKTQQTQAFRRRTTVHVVQTISCKSDDSRKWDGLKSGLASGLAAAVIKTLLQPFDTGVFKYILILYLF